MIRSFEHRGLKTLYDGRTAKRVPPDHVEKLRYDGRTAKRVPPDHVEKLRDILAVLDGSLGPVDMDLPGFRLHALKGKWKGNWAVSVSGNWRVTFRFEEGHAVEVDYVDYHEQAVVKV